MTREAMRQAMAAVDRSPALALPQIGVSRRAIVETIAGEWGLLPEERRELHRYVMGDTPRPASSPELDGPAAA